MSWIYLIIASLFEICWIYSLKYLKWSDLVKVNLLKLHQIPEEFLVSVFAFIGYIVFGIANVTFFSLALKQISASFAFAVWMAVSLIGSRIIDIVVYKEPYSHSQLFFMIVIVAGVIGLKITSGK